MKVSPLVLALAGMLVGALAWGSCNASRASQAEIRLAAVLADDSLAAAQWARTRDSLATDLRELRGDSAMLAVRSATARRAAQAAHDSIGALLAILPDTQRLPLERAVTVLQAETAACRESLANCELRAANAEARVRGDSLRVASLTLLTDSLEAAWRTAQRQSAPGFLGLRSFWRARSWTVPLAALTAFLLLQK